MQSSIGYAAFLALAVGCGAQGNRPGEVTRGIEPVDSSAERDGGAPDSRRAESGGVADGGVEKSDASLPSGWPEDLRYELRQVGTASRLYAMPGDADLGAARTFMPRGLLDLCGPVPEPVQERPNSPARRAQVLAQPRDGRPVLPVSVVIVDGAAVVVVSLGDRPTELGRLPLPGPSVSAEWAIAPPTAPGLALRFEVSGRAMPGPGGGMPGPLVTHYLGFPSLQCGPPP